MAADCVGTAYTNLTASDRFPSACSRTVPAAALEQKVAPPYREVSTAIYQHNAVTEAVKAAGVSTASFEIALLNRERVGLTTFDLDVGDDTDAPRFLGELHIV